jgi:phosphate transport system permease protein
MAILKTKNDKSNPRLNEALIATRHRRHYYDMFASKLIAFSGIGVIVTISLIFVYLLKEVLPLFKAAEIERVAEYQILELEDSAALHWAMDEPGLSALRLNQSGSALFIDTQSGEILDTLSLPIGAERDVTTFAFDSDESGVFALGLDDGSVVVAQYLWQSDATDQNNQRQISPTINFLFEVPKPANSTSAVTELAIRLIDTNYLLAITNNDGQFHLLELKAPDQAQFPDEFFQAEPMGVEEIAEISRVFSSVDKLFIDGDGRFLFRVSQTGEAVVYDVKRSFLEQSLAVAAAVELGNGSETITDIQFLLGELSLIVATDSGSLAQWFVVRSEEEIELVQIRDFELRNSSIRQLATEQRRKNFAAVDAAGNLAMFNTTANRLLFRVELIDSQPVDLVISPRGTRLLVESANNHLSYWRIDNPHPEISFSTLWSRVWYESYPEPEYVWQSSSASNDFEPKFSLAPLTFGTLKAAFYAMLFASPLAICAAIYTGYFMTPVLRRSVKPMIELMEALPTVVLGFLAGLWLAPFVEANLLGILSLLVFMPLGIGLSSFLWFIAPKKIRLLLSDGWEAIFLVPVVVAILFVSLSLGPFLEAILFDGNIQRWLSEQYGISYNERNAMIVGFAMGFAVIPTIYSIAEDAIFSVPKHLSDGSLALGATAWQSLFYVVLPMASPGIFSALMIGLGRAVGETMIVLMATGNTPIIDMNLFEGMRTLAANMAVEVPESEVDSTHYRILFLAALCLFLFTFVVNTIAEVVRQRLRLKYRNL